VTGTSWANPAEVRRYVELEVADIRTEHDESVQFEAQRDQALYRFLVKAALLMHQIETDEQVAEAFAALARERRAKGRFYQTWLIDLATRDSKGRSTIIDERRSEYAAAACWIELTCLIDTQGTPIADDKIHEDRVFEVARREGTIERLADDYRRWASEHGDATTFGWKPPREEPRFRVIPPQLLAELAEGHEVFDPCPLNPTFDGLAIPWALPPVINVVNPTFREMRRWKDKAEREWKERGCWNKFIAPAFQDGITRRLREVVGVENTRHVLVNWLAADDLSPNPVPQACVVFNMRPQAEAGPTVSPTPVLLPTHLIGRNVDEVRAVQQLRHKPLADLIDRIVHKASDEEAKAFLKLSGGRIPSQIWDFDPSGALGFKIDFNSYELDDAGEADDGKPSRTPLTPKEVAAANRRYDERINGVLVAALDRLADMPLDFKQRYLPQLAKRMREIEKDFEREKASRPKQAA
jgi:hypothetical protein